MNQEKFEQIKDDVLKFVYERKGTIVKVAPIIAVVYFLYPILEGVWYWLPWICSIHYIYSSVDRETIELAIDFFKWYFDEKATLKTS